MAITTTATYKGSMFDSNRDTLQFLSFSVNGSTAITQAQFDVLVQTIQMTAVIEVIGPFTAATSHTVHMVIGGGAPIAAVTDNSYAAMDVVVLAGWAAIIS